MKYGAILKAEGRRTAGLLEFPTYHAALAVKAERGGNRALELANARP
jgi:hypothetical protein